MVDQTARRPHGCERVEMLCRTLRAALKKIRRAQREASVLTHLSLPVCLSGVLVAGGFGNFCTEATGFSRQFPGLTSHLLMLPFWFRVPVFRDYIMCGGTHLSDLFALWNLLSLS